MSERVLVAPYVPRLLKSFSHQTYVIRTKSPQIVPQARDDIGRENKLYAVRLESALPLTEIPITETWKSIPLALYVPALGKVRDLLRSHEMLKQLNVRVFLPGTTAESYTHAKILASLGVHSGIWFDGPAMEWDLLNDLMHYAVYGAAPHATIEPFQFILSHYNPRIFQDFSAVYFDDPGRYLHLDETGHIALTAAALAAGEYVAEGPEGIKGIETTTAYGAFVKHGQEHLLAYSPCSRCPAFRICTGRYPAHPEPSDHCQRFFSDLLEACEFYARRLDRDGVAIWQS